MAAAPVTHDFAIVGAGVVGLSLAYELARRGHSVVILDRKELGHEASWAGAGMIPPGSPYATASPLDRFSYLCERLHADWAEALHDETGIDNGYWRCGSIHIGHPPNPWLEISSWQEELSALGIRHTCLTSAQLASLEPNLSSRGDSSACPAVLLRDEAQIRSPRHLQALIAACQNRQVAIMPHREVKSFETSRDRVVALQTNHGTVAAREFVVTAGSWTGPLVARLGMELSVRPIRGQMLLLRSDNIRLRHIVVVGPRYLVPRHDGLVLVGSTEEDVGFRKGNTAEAIEQLFGFAVDLIPELATASREGCWSGLRPQVSQEGPAVGPLSGWSNAWMATGHFRAGLQWSTGTATLLADALEGRELPPEWDALTGVAAKRSDAEPLPAKFDA